MNAIWIRIFLLFLCSPIVAAEKITFQLSPQAIPKGGHERGIPLIVKFSLKNDDKRALKVFPLIFRTASLGYYSITLESSFNGEAFKEIYSPVFYGGAIHEGNISEPALVNLLPDQVLSEEVRVIMDFKFSGKPDQIFSKAGDYKIRAKYLVLGSNLENPTALYSDELRINICESAETENILQSIGKYDGWWCIYTGDLSKIARSKEFQDLVQVIAKSSSNSNLVYYFRLLNAKLLANASKDLARQIIDGLNPPIDILFFNEEIRMLRTEFLSREAEKPLPKRAMTTNGSIAKEDAAKVSDFLQSYKKNFTSGKIKEIEAVLGEEFTFSSLPRDKFVKKLQESAGSGSLSLDLMVESISKNGDDYLVDVQSVIVRESDKLKKIEQQRWRFGIRDNLFYLKEIDRYRAKD